MHYPLFSEREKERLGEGGADVLRYDNLPLPFRNQVIYLLDEMLGRDDGRNSRSLGYWSEIYKIYSREKGWAAFFDERMSAQGVLSNYLRDCDTKDALDLIDVCFFWGGFFQSQEQRNYDPYHDTNLERFDHAVEELNSRFRQHAIGYELIDYRLVRIDSQLLHQETVRPAVQLMLGAGENFAGPLQEFVDAHGKYRAGEYKDAIVSAFKSLESVMKSICTERKWDFDPTDTASRLTSILLTKDLIPSYLQTQFNSLKSLLDSGAATVRNRTSGHGQGPKPLPVPDYLVRYALHLTASNIVMLIEAHKALP